MTRGFRPSLPPLPAAPAPEGRMPPKRPAPARPEESGGQGEGVLFSGTEKTETEKTGCREKRMPRKGHPQTERDRLLRFFPALAAFPVVQGEDAAALRTGIGCFLLFHKALQAVRLNKTAVFHQAGLIALVVAFFKVSDPPAGIAGTFKAMG